MSHRLAIVAEIRRPNWSFRSFICSDARARSRTLIPIERSFRLAHPPRTLRRTRTLLCLLFSNRTEEIGRELVLLSVGGRGCGLASCPGYLWVGEGGRRDMCGLCWMRVMDCLERLCLRQCCGLTGGSSNGVDRVSSAGRGKNRIDALNRRSRFDIRTGSIIWQIWSICKIVTVIIKSAGALFSLGL
jgi:hypothetical protein